MGGVPSWRRFLHISARRLVPAILILCSSILPFGLFSHGQSAQADVGGGTPGLIATATSASVPVAEATPPQHYVVLVVIDAGQAADVDLANLPHVHALMQNGVTYDRAFVGQLESSTPGVHVTLGTGTLPRENGFLGFGWAAADTRA